MFRLLRRHAFVAVMEPATHGKSDQLARPVHQDWLLLDNGRPAIQSLVRTGHMVVLLYV